MRYRERLSVPALWWLLAAVFGLSLLLGIGLYLGPIWGLVTATAGLVIAAGLFLHAGILLVVDTQAIRIGRAEIGHRYIASCRALDAGATRRRGGVEADARAHLVLRPYIATAVEITLADPADPVPYWLVSSRRPQELAAALATVIGRPTAEDDARPRPPQPAGTPDDAAEPRLTE